MAGRGSPYAYDWLVILLFVPYLLLLWSLARSRSRAFWRWSLAAAGALAVALIFVRPLQSHDVYQYLFYGRIQVVHGANPYLARPFEFSADAWYRYVGWRGQVSVYGPVWTDTMAAVVRISGSSVTVAVRMAKGVAVALGAVAVWGLARLEAGSTEEGGERRGVAAAAFALNPLVLATVAIGGHADAALAAAFVWAAVWDRRGRPFVATVLLAAACLVKAYALPVLAVYLIVRWRRNGVFAAAGSAGASIGLAAASYAPYWAGAETFRGIAQVGAKTSGSLARVVQRGLSALLSTAGAASHASIASATVRFAAAGSVVAALAMVARSPRSVSEPWRAATLVMGVSLLVTPWVLPWYVVGPLALGLAEPDPRLRRASLVASSTWSLSAFGPGGIPGTLVKYGAPVGAYLGDRLPGVRRRAVSGSPRGPSTTTS